MHRLLGLALVMPALTLPAGAAGEHADPLRAGATIDPAAFTSTVDNAWYPLRPGTTYVYRGRDNGQPSRDVVTVTRRTARIAGVRCVVVRDDHSLSGRLVERTSDWFAQDRRGSVWYFGEATGTVDAAGRVTSTEGSWRAGVDGALPGIVMPAHPMPGQSFRQENYPGHAEDRFDILSVTARVRVPYAAVRRAVLTREWSPLDAGATERKLYARGIGLVEEAAATGAPERAVLVSVTRR